MFDDLGEIGVAVEFRFKLNLWLLQPAAKMASIFKNLAGGVMWLVAACMLHKTWCCSHCKQSARGAGVRLTCCAEK
jgi:hypothetical protein